MRGPGDQEAEADDGGFVEEKRGGCFGCVFDLIWEQWIFSFALRELF